MEARGTIRVVLADDHSVVRKGIREFLEEEGDIQVVAEAEDGEMALEYAEQHRPDVLVLDIRMPKLTGIEVTRHLKARHPEVKVLILTAYDYDPYIFAALQAGCDGYILKTARSHELRTAVRTVAQGGSALDPQVTSKLVKGVVQGVVEQLSEREMEVLHLVAKGLSNRAIGRELNISDRTVQGHLANIFQKLGVSTRTEAVIQALRLGLMTLDELFQ